MGSMRLDFGCGSHPKEGFEGVDVSLTLPIKHRVNLLVFPLPWKDSSVDEIWCSHFIEHIPAREVTDSDLHEWATAAPKSLGTSHAMLGQDMLLAFFDECWRILKPGGKITVVWPALQTSRAFKDPTHRRFMPLEMVDYLSAEGRMRMGLTHYHAKCNFTSPASKHPQVANNWNDNVNYQTTLTAVK